MSSEIPFSVFTPTGRRFWHVEWKDPRTGKIHRRSTKCTRKRDADREATRIVDEWQSKRGREGDDAWDDFRTVHAEEFLPQLDGDTQRLYGTIFNAIENWIKPRRMSDLDAKAISKLSAQWRKNKVSEYSIRTYLSHLKKAFKWAVSQGRMPEVPPIEMPNVPRKGKAKGRPISAEEFDRMLAAVPKIVKKVDAAASWQHFLRGLWLSSLRLDEALSLTWNDYERMRVDLEGPFPAFIIPSYTEKGRQDRIVPIMPDFAALLRQTPEDQRTGFVFVIKAERKRKVADPNPRNMQYVSAKISKFGQRAGIIVGRYVASGKTKYASAHDLRRSFGKRWAGMVRNAFDLKTLMRHESIQTTEVYYAHEDAAELAADLMQRFTDASTDTPVSQGSKHQSPSVSTPTP